MLPAGFSTSSARALACPSHCGQCAASVARPRELQDLYTVARELQESRARYTKCVWSVWGSRLRGFQCKNLAVGQHHTAPEPRTTPLSSRTVGHPEERRATCAGRGPTPGGWKREMIDGRRGSRGGPAFRPPPGRRQWSRQGCAILGLFRWISPRGADDSGTDDAWVRAGHCRRPTFAGPICGAPHGYLGLTDHRRVSVPGALPLGRCGISNIGAPSRGQCAAPQAHSSLAPARTPRAHEGAVPWQMRAPSASHRQRASA